MEDALGIKYRRRKCRDGYCYINESKYAVIRYADDFIVLCESLEDANKVYELLEDYLKDRGLTLAPDKTKITHIDEGFDFLGFNIKRYKGADKSRVLIKASKDNIKSFKKKRRCNKIN